MSEIERSRPPVGSLPEFRLEERTKGPPALDGSKAGRISLVDPNGKKLWTAWLGPLEPEVWTALEVAVSAAEAN